MKVLTLIRHAKSSWDDPSLPDKLRPLNDRGRHDAPILGERLARYGAKPDLILSSPATRALTTAEIIAEKVGYPRKAIIMSDQLYGAKANDLLAVIRELDDTLERVMLFGHNPELTDLANHLTSGEINHIPTCGAVALTFSTKTWSSISHINQTKIKCEYPKTG